MNNDPKIELLKKKSVTAAVLILFVAVFFVLQVFYAPLFDVLIVLLSVLVTIEIIGLFTRMGRPLYTAIAVIVPLLFFALIIIGFIWSVAALWLFLIALGIMLVCYIGCVIWGFVYKKEISEDTFAAATGMSAGRFIIFKANNTLGIFIYPNFLLFFMYLINHINTLKLGDVASVYGGTSIALFGLILLFAVTSMSDTFANITGTFLKGPKVFPVREGKIYSGVFYPNGGPISANKTWSGCIGGLFGGMIAGVVVYFIFASIFPAWYSHIFWWQFLIVGFFGSVVAQIGDLFESYLKRKAKVKDAGTLLKSHGGVADRVDALVFNTPFIFICLLLIL